MSQDCISYLRNNPESLPIFMDIYLLRKGGRQCKLYTVSTILLEVL